MTIEIFRQAVVLTIATLFPIMNPFSTAPLFISLTAGADQTTRDRTALLACLYALIILIVFLLLGAAIIEFFGISVAGIRVAGGFIICVLGFRMLFPSTGVQNSGAPQMPEVEIAFTPLAMPSLAGPGSISVVLTAASQIRRNHPENYVLIYAGVMAGMAATLLAAFFILRAASSLARILGPSGIDALTRIFGFLLIAIGTQFLLIGIGDFFSLGRV